MDKAHRSFCQRVNLTGSALILTVVLTSLLAIVGVLFVMMSRIEKISTTAVSENRELHFAVDTILARLSEELMLDIPGAGDPNQEYYDYPDANNAWLAALEPYKSGDDYFWGQISDVTSFLRSKEWDTNDIMISNSDPDSRFKAVVAERKAVSLSSSGGLLEQLADADGDGVADSKWIELDDVTTSKGKPIYAAVRVIDNGGMLNLNTGYKFDPNSQLVDNVDGSSVLQVNLMGLASRPGTLSTTAGEAIQDEAALLLARANYGVGVSPSDLIAYEENVIWQYEPQMASYTPFDISDELELRYRFLLNHTGTDTRAEQWGGEFRKATSSTPFKQMDEWLPSVCAAADAEPNLDPNYAYRHIATTCNMDRIINPSAIALDDGTSLRKMVNVNRADLNLLHEAIRAALFQMDPNFLGADGLAAQMTVNIADFRDEDSEMSFIDVNNTRYYGFEAPCIYISEVAYRFVREESTTHTSYAIELYRPYFEDEDPNLGGWEIVVDGVPTAINWSGSRRFHVIRFEDPDASLPVVFSDPEEPVDTSPYGYNRSQYIGQIQEPSSIVFGPGSTISLQRKVQEGYVVVDSLIIPDGWFLYDGRARSIQRDITRHKCIRRLWSGASQAADPTLGWHNSFISSDALKVQAHPADEPFTNIGEIGMVLRSSAYNVLVGCTETDVRIDPAQMVYANLFNYLTVFDPNMHGRGPEETRIKGRININTAPWFVIAQLPWVSAHTPNYWLAKAIVAYRDKTSIAGGPDYSSRIGPRGFRNIGELIQVTQMGYYAGDSMDLEGFPDLTPNDGAVDDFEERDVIFSRISNLVTVRSDVFTAYILVRLDADGPQKRVIAVLDRSEAFDNSDKVRIIALHTVPDPR